MAEHRDAVVLKIPKNATVKLNYEHAIKMAGVPAEQRVIRNPAYRNQRLPLWRAKRFQTERWKQESLTKPENVKITAEVQ